MTGDRIETAEERDALPVTTVIRDAQGAVFERFAEGFWVATGEEIGGVPEVPAIVLYRPDAPRPATFTDSSCEHCPDGHADPTSRPWGVYVAAERDGDGQPIYLRVQPTAGQHVAKSDAEWVRERLNAAPVTDLRADIEALAASNGAWKGDKHVRVTQRTDYGEVTRSAIWVDDLRAILAAHPTVGNEQGWAWQQTHGGWYSGPEDMAAIERVADALVDAWTSMPSSVLDRESWFRLARAAVQAAHPTVESAGVDLIAAERRRQVEVEGYTAEHDDGHESALARAAACYAMPIRTALLPHEYGAPSAWPWTREFWKPTPGDRVRELVKAGALIAAAIDAHLTRQEPSDDAR